MAAKMIRKFKFVAFSLPLLALLGLTPASAGIASILSGTFGASTGYWGSQVASATGNGSTGAYSINWSGSTNKQYEMMSLINVGAYDLIAGHLTFSSAKPNGDSSNGPNLTFETCPGTWNLATFACSETVTAFGSGTGGTVNLNLPIAAGSRVIFRVNSGKANGGGAYVTSINALTSRSDIRAGVIRHT